MLTILTEDCIFELSKRIPRGCWISFISVCKAFNQYATEAEFDARANHLATLLLWYPDNDWDYEYLANNSKITLEVMKKIPDIGWVFGRNNSFTFNMYLDNPDLKWDLPRLCNIITADDIINNPTFPWDFEYLSTNGNITPEVLQAYPGQKWNFTLLSRNKLLVNELLTEYYKKINWIEFSKNPGVSFEFILFHPTFNWYRRSVGMNPNITEKIVNDHPDYPWDNYGLSSNHNISPQFMLERTRVNINWTWFSYNKMITIDIIKSNLDLPWDWNGLSKVIPIQDIINNLHFPWTKEGVSFNKSLTYDIIYSHYGIRKQNGSYKNRYIGIEKSLRNEYSLGYNEYAEEDDEHTEDDFTSEDFINPEYLLSWYPFTCRQIFELGLEKRCYYLSFGHY